MYLEYSLVIIYLTYTLLLFIYYSFIHQFEKNNEVCYKRKQQNNKVPFRTKYLKLKNYNQVPHQSLVYFISVNGLIGTKELETPTRY